MKGLSSLLHLNDFNAQLFLIYWANLRKTYHVGPHLYHSNKIIGFKNGDFQLVK